MNIAFSVEIEDRSAVVGAIRQADWAVYEMTEFQPEPGATDDAQRRLDGALAILVKAGVHSADDTYHHGMYRDLSRVLETVEREVEALSAFDPFGACQANEVQTATVGALPRWVSGYPYRVDFEWGMPGWGSDLDFVDPAGKALPLLVIDSAPEDVWIRFDDRELRDHQTWIVVDGKRGMRSAMSLARWLMSRTMPKGTTLNVTGVAIFAGRNHWDLPTWSALREMVPSLVDPMPECGEGESVRKSIQWSYQDTSVAAGFKGRRFALDVGGFPATVAVCVDLHSGVMLACEVGSDTEMAMVGALRAAVDKVGYPVEVCIDTLQLSGQLEAEVAGFGAALSHGPVQFVAERALRRVLGEGDAQ
ncbi:hypothetical protein [Rhodospirillum sp. A1_3_36]|uniref:hypothetical protein n=1 Tax=Rhodospirillum sp. A1_3_36 TaxID=3391666 RepID=UPI0039A65AA0